MCCRKWLALILARRPVENPWSTCFHFKRPGACCLLICSLQLSSSDRPDFCVRAAASAILRSLHAVIVRRFRFVCDLHCRTRPSACPCCSSSLTPERHAIMVRLKLSYAERTAAAPANLRRHVLKFDLFEVSERLFVTAVTQTLPPCLQVRHQQMAQMQKQATITAQESLQVVRLDNIAQAPPSSS